MNNLRTWELNLQSPYSLQLAADARICLTNYVDDQTWDIKLGQGDETALALHTRYGGRVGLASIVPLFNHEGRVIYQAKTYHQSPIITAFAPNYIATTAEILPDVVFDGQHIAFDSQVISGIYTLTNKSKQAVKLRFELFGHLGARGQEQKLSIVSMSDERYALSFAALAGLSPVVIVENGIATNLNDKSASPKIGYDIALKAGESHTVRWVHVGLADLRDSLALANQWLATDWQPYLDSINDAALTIPQVQTGNLDWDAVIASSYNYALQCILRPAGSLPRELLLTHRTPDVGYSTKGTGSDHRRGWDGQDMMLTYLLTPLLASIYPQAAEGIIRNYLANQQDDGSIDLKTSAVGEQSGYLCTPILTQCVWTIYEFTQNTAFITEIFDNLLHFFERWLDEDMDGDGFPEWQDDSQTGYVAFPTFSPARDWAQGAAINTVEAPDLLSYLICEAQALQQMASLLDDKGALKTLSGHIAHLSRNLDALWEGDHYAYRDRDTDITTTGTVLLNDEPGDIDHKIRNTFVAPNRVIVEIVGGVRHTPKITLTVEGHDTNGNSVKETATTDNFTWSSGFGSYTTQQIFSKVERIYVQGLSRVYRVFAHTMDTTELDINGVMPLITDLDNTKRVADLALSERLLRDNGFTMTDTKSEYFDPTNAEGAGGIWFYWNTLFGDGLRRAGYGDKITDIVKNQLNMLQTVLSETHEFGQFYHTDEAKALGDDGHASGIAPLHLLNQLFGVRILGTTEVWLDNEFSWGRGVTLRQHGVYVRRTNKRIKVEFPSGHVVELDPDFDEPQLIVDPEPIEQSDYRLIELPEAVAEPLPSEQPPPSTKKITIEVEVEE